MITANGYTLAQYPKNNLVVITLPQTGNTLTNTTKTLSNRRDVLTEEEEAILLGAVIEMYEGDLVEDEE